MTRTEDQAWLEALAGRQAKNAPSTPASMEAAVLRGAILARAAAQPAPGDNDPVATDPRREARLLEQARRAGLLPRATPVRMWYAAAAIVACLAVGLVWLTRGNDQEVERGQAAAPQRIVADDPVELQHRILESLHAAGIDATGYESLGRRGIDADLPEPRSPAVQQVLEQYGLHAAPDGVLRVEIEPRGSP